MKKSPLNKVFPAIRKLAAKLLPARFAGLLQHKPVHPPLGTIDFGDFARIAPISADFGFARGTPVDRYYIEEFLEQNQADIRGRVMEVGEAYYSRKFGKDITRQDVLNLSDNDPATTIVGDLSRPGVLATESFDCIIITQTLQYVYDLPAGIAQLKDALRPGGVVLATLPAITPIVCPDWEECWYWSFTRQSARKLFGEAFGPENIEIEAKGNAFAATCFLQGIAVEELGPEWLDPHDPGYPVSVTVKAWRAG